MWLTQHCIAKRDCSKILILLEIFKTHNRPREELYVSSGVERSFPYVGCARNKLQSQISTESEVISLECRFAHGQSLRSWSLVFDHWFIPQRSATRYVMNLVKNIPTKRRNSLTHREILVGHMLITSHQTQNFLALTLAIIFLRTKNRNQDDHQKQTSDDVTHVPKPRSYAWLTIR